MTTAQKMLISIVALIAMIAVIYYGVTKNKDENVEIETNNNQVNSVFNQYIEKSNEGNQTNNTLSTINSNTNSPMVEVKGTDEEKAIALAKNKWGAEDKTVAFNIAKKEDKIYYVSVNNKETTEVLAWYKINIENGEVSDY